MLYACARELFTRENVSGRAGQGNGDLQRKATTGAAREQGHVAHNISDESMPGKIQYPKPSEVGEQELWGWWRKEKGVLEFKIATHTKISHPHT